MAEWGLFTKIKLKITSFLPLSLNVGLIHKLCHSGNFDVLIQGNLDNTFGYKNVISALNLRN